MSAASSVRMMPTARSAVIGPDVEGDVALLDSPVRWVSAASPLPASTPAERASWPDWNERSRTSASRLASHVTAPAGSAPADSSSSISCWIVCARCCTVISTPVSSGVNVSVVAKSPAASSGTSTLVVGSTATLVKESATEVTLVAPVGFQVTFVPARGSSPAKPRQTTYWPTDEVGGREDRHVLALSSGLPVRRGRAGRRS